MATHAGLWAPDGSVNLPGRRRFLIARRPMARAWRGSKRSCDGGDSEQTQPGKDAAVGAEDAGGRRTDSRALLRWVRPCPMWCRFYSERIASEGYLRTALEDRSRSTGYCWIIGYRHNRRCRQYHIWRST